MRNAEGKLPVITDQAAESCGCDRRTVLGGLAVGALVAGCRIDDPGAGGDGGVDPDGAPTDGPAGNGVAMCGANLCLDLTHPMNAMLAAVDGSRVIPNGTKKIMVVRTSETAFSTVSAICTHTGCTVRFAAAADQLQCPCHGSKYLVDGTLVIGANGSTTQAALRAFTNTFDAPGNLLTITLT